MSFGFRFGSVLRRFLVCTRGSSSYAHRFKGLNTFNVYGGEGEEELFK